MTREELIKRKIASARPGITLEDVDKVLNSHIRYIRKEIGEGNLELRVPYLGTFRTTEKKLEKHIESVKKKYGTPDSRRENMGSNDIPGSP